MWLWLCALLLFTSGVFGQTCEESILYCPWVVYYGINAPVERFKAFNPVVLDPGYSAIVGKLRSENKTVYGYLSLGEVANSRPYFQEVKEKGLLLQENPNWPGSYFVDIRKEAWARLVLDQLIPELITKGFHGVFLDTLDNPLYLENTDAETFVGMKKAAAQLVQLIRVYFPDIRVMMNRAYALLPDVGDSIHGVVAESLYTEYNFKTKSYAHRPEEQYDAQVKELKAAASAFPHLQLFSLDYWYPDRPEEIKEIYAKERSQGFRPYVTVISLTTIIQEPKP